MKTASNWAEVTWSQARELYEGLASGIEPSRVPLLGIKILTGKDWSGSTDIEGFRAAEEALSWFWEEEEVAASLAAMEMAHIDKVSWQGNTYTLPADLGAETVGQYQDCMAVAMRMAGYLPKLTESPIDMEILLKFLDDSRLVFAIYFSKVVTGKYDHAQAASMDIGEIPFAVVMKWRGFFLSRLRRS